MTKYWIRAGLLTAVVASAAAAAQDEAPAEPAPTESAEAPAEPLPVVPVADEAPEAPPVDSDATELDDITVTATKREKSVREIPVSVDAFSGDDLVKRGANALEEILKYSAGVTFNANNNPDNAAVTIRGIASENRNALYGRPTGYLYEDTTLTNPSLLGVVPEIDPSDLATVEVLKGPQGTLFGGSALSGAIRFVPNRPEFGALHYDLSAGASGMADSAERGTSYTGMLNLPVGESFALRFSGALRDRPGYVDDERSGAEDINTSEKRQGRGMLAWQPLGWLTLEAGYLRRELITAGGDTIESPAQRSTNIRRLEDRSDSSVSLASARLNADFDFATVTAIGSRMEKRGFFLYDLSAALGQEDSPTSSYQHYKTTTDQPGYELRIVSNAPTGGNVLLRDWQYLAGVFYSKSDQFLDLRTIVDAAGGSGGQPPVANSSDSILQVLAKEKAAFVELSRVLGSFELTLGGRYYDQFSDGESIGAVNGIPLNMVPVIGVPIPDPGVTTFEQRLPEKGFNPKLALGWQASKAISLYASAVRGFRFGGFNTVDPLQARALDIPLTFKSDSLWNYELGIRTDWFERRLTADLTGFYIDWTKPQSQQLKAGAFAYNDNVGGARSQGVEGQIRALLPWGLSLTTGGAYIDARTTEAFESAEGPVPAGTRMPATPRLTGSAVLGYSNTWGQWLGNATWSASYYGETYSTLGQALLLPSFTTQGASLNLAPLGWKYTPSVNLNVINIFDEHAFGFAFFGGVPAATRGVAIAPRTVTLTISFKY